MRQMAVRTPLEYVLLVIACFPCDSLQVKTSVAESEPVEPKLLGDLEPEP